MAQIEVAALSADGLSFVTLRLERHAHPYTHDCNPRHVKNSLKMLTACKSEKLRVREAGCLIDPELK